MKQSEDPNPKLESLADQTRGTVSKRTKLRLSKEALEAKRWLARHLNVSMKDILDLAPALGRIVAEDEGRWPEGLETSAKPDWARSSHAISARSLRELRELSKQLNVSRDRLANDALLAFQGMEHKRLRELPKKLDNALGLVQNMRGELEEVEDTLRELLGSESPVYEKFGFSITDLNEVELVAEEEMERAETAIKELDESEET